MTPKQIQNKIKSNQTKVQKLESENFNLRKNLKGICDHPNPQNFTWEHDNGYGGLSRNVGLICYFCGAKKYWLSSNHWSDQ